MRSLFSLLTVMLLFGCSNMKDARTRTNAPEINNEMAIATIAIEGMACQAGCADAIQKNLLRLEGISSAEVSYESGKALVAFIPSKINSDIIQETITNTKVKDYKYVIKDITINTKTSE